MKQTGWAFVLSHVDKYCFSFILFILLNVNQNVCRQSMLSGGCTCYANKGFYY